MPSLHSASGVDQRAVGVDDRLLEELAGCWPRRRSRTSLTASIRS